MWQKIKVSLPVASIVAAIYYADNIIFGSIIIAVTAWLGGWTAFMVLVPLFWAMDYWLGRQTLKIVIEEKTHKKQGKIINFVRRWFDSFRSAMPALQKRLSDRNKLRIRSIGFVIASYFGTAFLTIPAMYLMGQRRYLRTLTAISAFIYSVAFVAQYALGTSITLAIYRHVVSWL